MAGKYIGRQQSLGIGKETTRGTAVVPAFWLPLINFDFDDKFEHVIDEQLRGIIEDSEDLKVVKKWSEGEIEGHIRDKSFGLLLLAGFGAISSVVKETTAYNHTYSVQNGIQHQSLTVEGKNSNEQLAFVLAMINSLKIKAELGKFVEFTAKLIAKLGASASNTPATTVENKFLAKDIIVKFADNLAGLDGASAIKVKNVNLTINKNIESDDILGSIAPDDYNNKQIAIEGGIELNYDAATYKALALAGTQKAMRIDIINTDVTIGASSNPELKIDLARVKFTEWSKSGGLNDIVKQTLNFKAFYSISDSKMVSVVLTNTQTAY